MALESTLNETGLDSQNLQDDAAALVLGRQAAPQEARSSDDLILGEVGTTWLTCCISLERV